jgi:hypothetical protein
MAATMFMHFDTLAAIDQERRTDLMREATVLRLLRKERTTQSLSQRFRAFVTQRIRPWTGLQMQQSEVRESLSRHSTI